MTLKDEFLMIWIVCVVVVTFAARHLFGGLVYLVEKIAAFSIVYLPGILHLPIGHIR